MSIITSFVNVIAGASVLLGGKAFMDEQIGTEGPTLRKAIGAPLLGIGALGIAISYVRNKRVRDDKKAESDYYEAELYEADESEQTSFDVINIEYIEDGEETFDYPEQMLISVETRENDHYTYTKDRIRANIKSYIRRNFGNDVEVVDFLAFPVGSNIELGQEFEADAETFCADKNCGCGQDPCKTYGVESFEATDVGKRMKCRSCSQWEFVKGVAMNNFLQDDKGKWRCYDCLYDKPKHKVVVIGRGKHKPFVSEAETFEAIMSTDKTFTGETASGHKVLWDDGSFTMTFAEPIDGYTDVSGYWYGGDDRTPSSFTLDVQNDDYESIDLYIDGVEAYGVSTNHMGVNEDELSLQVREAVKEGLDWMLGDYEEKTVVERQYRAEEEEDWEYHVYVGDSKYGDMFIVHNARDFGTKEEAIKAAHEVSKDERGKGEMVYVVAEEREMDIEEVIYRIDEDGDVLRAETFEATPYGEEDMEYPVRIIVGGPPHSGKSTLMNLLEDKMNQYGVDVELRDLDFSSPTNLKAGFDPNRETKDWDEDLARDAASYFREDSEDKIVLGDSIGLISQINEIVSEPADVAILLVSGSKDQFDQSFRNALAKWKSYYEFIDLPILMIIRSSMNPNEMNYFDPHDNYGVIVGLDRDAYGEGTPQDNEISLENACLEGMVFEIAQEYDLELANRNTDKHIDTISEKWPNIEGKPTWNPIDAGKPHLGKIEDEYFSTFDERRKAKAMSAEGMPRLGGQEVWVRVETQKIGNNEGRMDSEIAGQVTGYFTSEFAAHMDADKRLAQYEAIPQRFMNDLTKNRSKITVISYLKDGRQPTIVNKIEYIATERQRAESFAVENDPDFDKVKADRNKDGEISDWEQSVGNAVAKGIREHGQKKDKSPSVGDMEHYMNMRWKQYTPRQKMDMELMDLHYGHSNKNTKRYFKKGYEYGWNLAREKAANGEPLYMVARAKDLITTSFREDGVFVDSGAWAGFEDSWRTYEGDEPFYNNEKVMSAESLSTHMAEEEADFYTVLYRETEDDNLEVEDDFDNLNEAMSAYQRFINQGMEEVIVAGYDRIDEGGYEEKSVAIAEYLVNGYDRRPPTYN